jgi:hypothetical protein
MGYTICKSYYNNSTDKKKAIKEIIELNFKNEDDIERFLSNSKYYPEPLNKAELVKAFEAKNLT